MSAAAPTIPLVQLLDGAQVTACLDRIGAPSRPERNEATLRELQLAPLLTVPFEKLSIHLGEPISLDPDEIFDKIVVRCRGGFCYELNGLRRASELASRWDTE